MRFQSLSAGGPWTVGGLVYSQMYDDSTGKAITSLGENGSTTCYWTEVTGRNGEDDVVMYYDIGSSYAYVNKYIRDVRGIRTLSFVDCQSGSHAYQWLDVTIDDEAFGSQFSALYMKYLVTSGTDHTIMLRPTDVKPAGSGMLANCPLARIYVDAEYYDDFINDSRWSAYSNQIVSTTEMRMPDFNNGSTSYAQERHFDATGSQVIESGAGGVNVYPVHVTGPSGSLDEYGGTAVIYNDPGTTYAYRTTKIWADAFRGNTELKNVRFFGAAGGTVYTDVDIAIGSRAFADCDKLRMIDLVYGNTNTKQYEALSPSQIYPVDGTMIEGSPYAYIRVWPDLVDDFKNDVRWHAYADRIIPWEQGGTEYINVEGANYQCYIEKQQTASLDFVDLHSGKAGHNDMLREYLLRDIDDYVSLDVDPFIVAQNSYNTYYTSVTGASTACLTESAGKLTVYNDIGSYYNYRTVCIESTAFSGNVLLRRLDFGDICTSGTTYLPLQIKIQKGAFKGCTSLRSIDMIYHKYTGTNEIVFLTPDQVIPAKDIFDEDSRTQIRVAPQYVDSYRQDPNWSQYSERIVPYTTSYTQYDIEGVTYGFFPVINEQVKQEASGDHKRYYSALYNDFFKTDYNNLHNGYGDFIMEYILVTDSVAQEDDIWYMQIEGVDNDVLDAMDGHLNIYNDIGETYSYKTIAVSRDGFRGNTHIKSVGFTDLYGPCSTSNDSQLGILLPNRCFEGCSNLKYIDMIYLVTLGVPNHYDALGPKDVIIGDSAFIGCPDDFEIRVCAERYAEFMSDVNWRQYRNRIVIYDYTPTVEDPITCEGIIYNYASRLINNLPTEQKAFMAWSLWNIPIILVKEAVMAALSTVGSVFGGAAVSAFQGMEWNAALMESLSSMISTYGMTSIPAIIARNAAVGITSTATGILVSEMEGGTFGDIMGTLASAGVSSTIMGLQSGIVKGIVDNSVSKGLLKGAVSMGSGLAAGNMTQLMKAYGAIQEIGNTDEPIDLDVTECDPSDDLIGQMSSSSGFFDWLGGKGKTRKIQNVYHMYIEGVDNGVLDSNGGRLHIYNDVGSYWHYRTVAVHGSNLRGNTHIRTIDFQDCAGNVINNQTVFQLAVPDSAFMGCSNLERIDMYMLCTEGRNVLMPIGPENVCLQGPDVFEGCSKLKVHVAPERYEDFMNDSIWKKLDIVVDNDYSEPYHDYVWGAYYHYNYDMGTKLSTSEAGGHTLYNMHVVRPDDSYLSSHDGVLTLVTDYGYSYCYNTTYVKKKAFYGDANLKKVCFSDNYSQSGNVYASPKWELQDMAFAGCSNLTRVNLAYLRRGSHPHAMIPFKPSDITVGRDVFKNSDVKVAVYSEYYKDFIQDNAWSQYRDVLSPSLFSFADRAVREALSPFMLKVDGDGGFNPLFEITVDDYFMSLLRNSPEFIFKGKPIMSFPEFRYWGMQGFSEITPNMFQDCSSLRYIELPLSVKRIGDYAFDHCDSLTWIEIPDSVSYIGTYAFHNMDALREMIFISTKPAELADNALRDPEADFTIYVPSQAVEAYRQAWPAYASRICSIAGNVSRRYYIADMTEGSGSLAQKLGLKVDSEDHFNGSGWLFNLTIDVPGSSVDYTLIDSLKIIGKLSREDVMFLATLNRKYHKVRYLDLSEMYSYDADRLTQVAYWLDSDDGEVRYGAEAPWGEKMFSAMPVLETVIMPSFEGCYIKPYVGELLFAGSQHLKTAVFTGSGNSGFGPSMFSTCPEFSTVLALSDELIDFGKAFKSTNARIDLYCPYSLNASYSNMTSAGFAHVYSPYKDDRVFEILAMHDCYNFAKLTCVTSTGGWFRNSDIVSFDEFYNAVTDTVLADSCFGNCSRLRSIALPVSTAYIDATAFKGCTSLKQIKVLCTEPPVLENDSVFIDLPDDYRIIVLSSRIEKYLKQWPEEIASHIVTFEQSVKEYEITLSQAGSLADSLNLGLSANGMVITAGDYSDIKRLKVNGPVNAYDLNVMAALAGQLRSMKGEYGEWSDVEDDLLPVNSNLRYLNLYNAYFVNDNGQRSEEFILRDDQFTNSDVLQSVILPQSLERIPGGSFAYSNKLKTVFLGYSTHIIESESFTNCPKLKSFTTYRGDLDFAEDVFTPGYNVDSLFCAKDDWAVLSANVNVQKGFKRVIPSFTDRAVMKSVAEMGISTEDGLENLLSFDYFKGNLEAKDLSALQLCTKVTDLPDYAFKDCANLKRIVMPESISSLGNSLFDGCDALECIEWKGDLSELVTDVDRSDDSDSPFMNLPRRTLVFAPTNGNVMGENVIDTYADGAWSTEKLFLSDNYATVSIPYGFTAAQVELDRRFTPGAKSTVYLPFSLDSLQTDALGSFFEFQSYDNIEHVVTFRKVSETSAAVPYLFVPKTSDFDVTGSIPVFETQPDEGHEIGMYGTWEYRYWDEDPNNLYGYAGGTNGSSVSAGQFVRIVKGASIKPMRGWLRLENYSAPAMLTCMFVNEDDVPLGMVEIENGEFLDPDELTDVFSTDGRMVRHNVRISSCLESLPSGIYVVKGKKISIP